MVDTGWYRDPHLPCITLTVTTLNELLPTLNYAQLLLFQRQLFKHVCGFTDTTLNVDVTFASLPIHLEEVTAAAAKSQAASSFTSHYEYRFYEALDSTNTALGSRLSLETCIEWG